MPPGRPLLNRLTDPARTPPPLAAAVASVRASVRLRQPARVGLRDGYWVHWVRGTALVTRGYWTPGPDEARAGLHYEAVELARLVADGRQESALLPWAETERVMGLLDEVRAQLGVSLPGE